MNWIMTKQTGYERTFSLPGLYRIRSMEQARNYKNEIYELVKKFPLKKNTDFAIN